RFQPSALDALPGVRGQIVRTAVDIVADQAHQALPLLAGEAGVTNAGGRQVQFQLAIVLGEDIPRRYGIDHRDRPLGRRQAPEQRPRQVLFGGQDAQAGFRAVAHLRRVRPEEERCRRHQLATDYCEVDADVVPAGPPAPGGGPARFAENAERVALGIAMPVVDYPGQPLRLAEDRLEGDDLLRLLSAPGAQSTVEESQGGSALFRRHLFKPQPLVIDGRVVPDIALVPGERELRDGPLLTG